MGFDEHRDRGEMICKDLAKDFKLECDDDQENIQDLNAWTAMMPVHKQSKFGQASKSLSLKQSSKFVTMKHEDFTIDDYLRQEVDMNDGSTALISL